MNDQQNFAHTPLRLDGGTATITGAATALAANWPCCVRHAA